MQLLGRFKNASDHPSSVFLKLLVANAMGPDDSAEALANCLQRQHLEVGFGERPTQSVHECLLKFGVPNELLVS